ncbi:MAG: putative C-S lyase [Fibrobacteres bacterium]|nr:putative C-S lyase [Fibrobacterota bacterium]
MNDFDFERPIERRGTGCAKWDDAPRLFGSPGVLPMWVADMDFAAPPPVLEALRAQLEHGVYGYPASRHDEVVDALALWLERRQGWKVPHEWIVFAPGVVPALKNAIDAFTEEGDEILIQPPVYHPFFELGRSAGRVLSECPLVERAGCWEIDFEAFEAKAETAEAFVFCNPHNPVGRAWTKQELTTLAGICARTGTLILSDEIHADLVFAPAVHTPLAALGILDPTRIATFVAPTKTFNLAGLNISAAIIPDGAMRRKFTGLFDKRGTPCTNAPGLVAMQAAYVHGDAWLDALLAHLADNSRHIVDFARERWPGVVPNLPEATYLSWLDCRALQMSEAELVKLFSLKALVGLNRGGMFGEAGRGWMRLNFGTTRSNLDEALERIARALEKP